MRSVVAAVATVFLLACSDGATAPSHAGTYALVSLNGAALPVVLDEFEDGRVELTHGEIVLRDDNTFDDVIEFTEFAGEAREKHGFLESGTWEIDGTSFRMTYDRDGLTIDGTLRNGRITQRLGALEYVYQRQ